MLLISGHAAGVAGHPGVHPNGIERGFQVLGEAARRVTESFKAAHPEIPWSSIVGHRNVIVHDYADLSSKRIWEVVEDDLLRLAQSLERLISPEMT